MNDVTSLYEFILRLLRDQHAQAEFRRDPRHVLERHGLHHVTADDIRDLMPVVVDHRAVQPVGDHAGVSMPSFALAPGNGDPHEVVHVIDHFMNNYTYNVNDSCNTTNFNDHSTTINDSVHTDFWGGDPSVTLDASNTVASAPGAVASDGAISGTVTTGPGDAVGTDAAAANGAGSVAGTSSGDATGNGDTVANGADSSAGNGNVTGTVSGSQVATTGGTSDNHPVTTTDSDNATTHLTSFGSGATNTIGNGDTSTAASNSGNTSNSHNASDTGNTTTMNTHTTNTDITHTTTDSNDGNGNHIDHNALGNSYSATDVHDTTDSNDHVLHLDVH